MVDKGKELKSKEMIADDTCNSKQSQQKPASNFSHKENSSQNPAMLQPFTNDNSQDEPNQRSPKNQCRSKQNSGHRAANGIQGSTESVPNYLLSSQESQSQAIAEEQRNTVDNLVQAKQIAFLSNNTGQSSPISGSPRHLNNQSEMERIKLASGAAIEPYIMDDDTKSYEEGPLDEEAEERAVAEFMSEIDLRNSAIKLRGDGQDSNNEDGSSSQGRNNDNKNNGEDAKDDDDVSSKQFSIDDVTDDEDGDQEAVDEPLSCDNDDDREQSQSSPTNHARYASDLVTNQTKDGPQGGKAHDDVDGSTKAMPLSDINQQLVSTTYDSATNRDSSSSNKELGKKHKAEAVVTPSQEETQNVTKTNQTPTSSSRLNDIRPNPIKSLITRADIEAEQKSKLEAHEAKVNEIKGFPLKTSQSPTSVLKSQRKIEPQLNREDVVKGNYQRFMAHIETREVPVGSSQSKLAKVASKCSIRSQSKSSSNTSVNKDNEDPNATIENVADQFDPKELKQEFDGWSLYKKTRISFAPVRRYQCMVDQDYKKNKVTGCAHLQNIYNSFCVKRGKPTYQMNNYFDIDKWNAKMEGRSHKDANQGNSPTKVLQRNPTLANTIYADESHKEKENQILSKTASTAHIPNDSKAKNLKRVYANFDKDLAVRMFGYRVIFQKPAMLIKTPDPAAPQTHKPLAKFVSDIIGELNQTYVQIPKYNSKQRILMPIPDSEDEESMEEVNQKEQDGSSPTPGDSKIVSVENASPLFKNSTTAGNSPRNDGGTESGSPLRNSQVKKHKNWRNMGGELVVLKTRQGDKQTFLKRTRNLLWHCAPPERQQSASSALKRTTYANRGMQNSSINQSSPTRTNTISPKKPLGWNAPKYTPQTMVNTIKAMSQVRYANKKNGTLYPPGHSGQTSMRFGSSGPHGGANNQNFNYYRKQNSYRKGQRQGSAKGGRGLRQSQENSNAAYKLINRQPSVSDQNFIINNDGTQIDPTQDQEVAKITGNYQPPTNVVHLRDPKHIEGFGSNIVHVNVSCGQTAPENKNESQCSKKPDDKAKAEPAAPEEEDEDAQTFIIQLTEEQTRQLAEGNLKLNGVPIPKDLSNLSYPQIMALLDSVNLPPQKNGKENKSATPVTNKLDSSKATKTGAKSQLTEANNYGNDSQRKNQPNLLGKAQVNQSLAQQQKKKQCSSSFNQSKTNHFMGSTFNNGIMSNQKTTTSNILGGGITNTDFFRQQQTYYAQGKNMVSQIDSNALMSINQSGLAAKSNSTTDPDSLIRSAQQPNRDAHRPLGGRQSQNQNYSSGVQGAPQKANRAESASRRARAARHQAGSQGTNNSKTLSSNSNKMQLVQSGHPRQNQRQRPSMKGSKNNMVNSMLTGQTQTPSAASSSAAGNLSQAMNTVNNFTRNGLNQGATGMNQNALSSVSGTAATSNSLMMQSNGMGTSEWNMLTMVQQQQQHLKNAQHFLQHTQINLEHARKMQATQHTMDSSMISSSDIYTNYPQSLSAKMTNQNLLNHPKVSKSANITGKQDSFNRATLGSIQANGSATQGQQSLQATQITPARNSIVSSNYPAQTSSQQMIPTTQAQHQSNSSVQHPSSFNYIRQSAPSHSNATVHQKNSLTRITSSKRMGNNGGQRKNPSSNNEQHLNGSASRSYLNQKSSAQTSARINPQQAQLANTVSQIKNNGNTQFKDNNRSTGGNTQTSKMLGNTSLFAHESKLLNNHHIKQQQQQMAATQGVVQGNGGPYGAVTQTGAATATMPGGQPNIMTSQVQAMNRYYASMSSNTGSQQPSQPIPNGTKHPAANGLNQHPKLTIPQAIHSQQQNQQSKKALLHAHDRNQVGAGSHYYTRMSEGSEPQHQATQPNNMMQKIRSNQHTLNNSNISYTNQSSTHKRKIESALAQSAISAIQNQGSSHHGGLHISAAANNTSISASAQKASPNFLQFEQKAYSQPQNEVTGAQPYHNSLPRHHGLTQGAQVHQPGQTASNFVSKSNDFRKHSQPPQQPSFIMRNNHAGLSSDQVVAQQKQAQQQPLGVQSDYAPGGMSLVKNNGGTLTTGTSGQATHPNSQFSKASSSGFNFISTK